MAAASREATKARYLAKLESDARAHVDGVRALIHMAQDVYTVDIGGASGLFAGSLDGAAAAGDAESFSSCPYDLAVSAPPRALVDRCRIEQCLQAVCGPQYRRAVDALLRRAEAGARAGAGRAAAAAGASDVCEESGLPLFDWRGRVVSLLVRDGRLLPGLMWWVFLGEQLSVRAAALLVRMVHMSGERGLNWGGAMMVAAQDAFGDAEAMQQLAMGRTAPDTLDFEAEEAGPSRRWWLPRGERLAAALEGRLAGGGATTAGGTTSCAAKAGAGAGGRELASRASQRDVTAGSGADGGGSRGGPRGGVAERKEERAGGGVSWAANGSDAASELSGSTDDAESEADQPPAAGQPPAAVGPAEPPGPSSTPTGRRGPGAVLDAIADGYADVVSLSAAIAHDNPALGFGIRDQVLDWFRFVATRVVGRMFAQAYKGSPSVQPGQPLHPARLQPRIDSVISSLTTGHVGGERQWKGHVRAAAGKGGDSLSGPGGASAPSSLAAGSRSDSGALVGASTLPGGGGSGLTSHSHSGSVGSWQGQSGRHLAGQGGSQGASGGVLEAPTALAAAGPAGAAVASGASAGGPLPPARGGDEPPPTPPRGACGAPSWSAGGRPMPANVPVVAVERPRPGGLRGPADGGAIPGTTRPAGSAVATAAGSHDSSTSPPWESPQLSGEAAWALGQASAGRGSAHRDGAATPVTGRSIFSRGRRSGLRSSQQQRRAAERERGVRRVAVNGRLVTRQAIRDLLSRRTPAEVASLLSPTQDELTMLADVAAARAREHGEREAAKAAVLVAPSRVSSVGQAPVWEAEVVASADGKTLPDTGVPLPQLVREVVASWGTKEAEKRAFPELLRVRAVKPGALGGRTAGLREPTGGEGDVLLLSEMVGQSLARKHGGAEGDGGTALRRAPQMAVHARLTQVLLSGAGGRPITMEEAGMRWADASSGRPAGLGKGIGLAPSPSDIGLGADFLRVQFGTVAYDTASKSLAPVLPTTAADVGDDAEAGAEASGHAAAGRSPGNGSSPASSPPASRPLRGLPGARRAKRFAFAQAGATTPVRSGGESPASASAAGVRPEPATAAPASFAARGLRIRRDAARLVGSAVGPSRQRARGIPAREASKDPESRGSTPPAGVPAASGESTAGAGSFLTALPDGGTQRRVGFAGGEGGQWLRGHAQPRLLVRVPGSESSLGLASVDNEAGAGEPAARQQAGPGAALHGLSGRRGAGGGAGGRAGEAPDGLDDDLESAVSRDSGSDAGQEAAQARADALAPAGATAAGIALPTLQAASSLALSGGRPFIQGAGGTRGRVSGVAAAGMHAPVLRRRACASASLSVSGELPTLVRPASSAAERSAAAEASRRRASASARHRASSGATGKHLRRTGSTGVLPRPSIASVSGAVRATQRRATTGWQPGIAESPVRRVTGRQPTPACLTPSQRWVWRRERELLPTAPARQGAARASGRPAPAAHGVRGPGRRQSLPRTDLSCSAGLCRRRSLPLPPRRPRTQWPRWVRHLTLCCERRDWETAGRPSLGQAGKASARRDARLCPGQRPTLLPGRTRRPWAAWRWT